MALSNSQYQEIMRDYQAQQLKNKHQQDERVSEIYQILPAVKELIRRSAAAPSSGPRSC